MGRGWRQGLDEDRLENFTFGKGLNQSMEAGFEAFAFCRAFWHSSDLYRVVTYLLSMAALVFGCRTFEVAHFGARARLRRTA